MGKIEFDLKELIRTRDRFQKAIDSNIMDKVIKDILLDLGKVLLAKTVYRTPVDTGQLKGAWELTNVIKDGDNYIITMFNPTEYAIYKEYGHRTSNHKKWIPGKFMATISMKEVERLIPEYTERHMTKMFKEILG